MRLLSVLDRYETQLIADGRSIFWRDQVKRHVQLFDRWLAAHRRSRDARTIDHEDLAAFLASPAATMRLDGRPKKQTSNNALRTSMRAFFLYAHSAGHAPRNAAALVRRARCATPPPRALPEADCRRLLATLAAAKGPVAERDHLLFRMLYTVGLRIGSALAIQVQDVDLRSGELTLTTMKNDRPDRVAIPKALRSQLRAALAGRTDGALFIGHGGRPVGARQARRRLEIWSKRAGIARTAPHQLRHSFAMSVYRCSKDLGIVQVALRHRSIASTLVYVRPDVRRLRQHLA